jgi:hypothetical protein
MSEIVCIVVAINDLSLTVVAAEEGSARRPRGRRAHADDARTGGCGGGHVFGPNWCHFVIFPFFACCVPMCVVRSCARFEFCMHHVMMWCVQERMVLDAHSYTGYHYMLLHFTYTVSSLDRIKCHVVMHLVQASTLSHLQH